MALAPLVRTLLPLVIGLTVGGMGATMFMDSLPATKGSPEERAQQLELELKKAQTRIAALEADDSASGSKRVVDAHGRVRPAKTFADGARSIGESIRAGRRVTPDDIFRASQPLIRDLAPLFDRMRIKQQRALTESLTGELARKYQLTKEQQTALGVWFEQRALEESKRFSDLIGREGTRLEDVVRATNDVRLEDGLENFMQGVLTTDKLNAFKTERLNERAERVQKQADMKVQRLDAIVKLDEAQRDQVFGIMARSSREYDPAMVLEGSRGTITASPSADPKQAMLAVLTPDQRATYEVERQRRRTEAAKELEAVGLALPPDWDLLDDSDFR